ncbi:MAG TPA: sigma-70 family RNA polymerase sigma factor [Pyrinomonadaceae bacterium]
MFKSTRQAGREEQWAAFEGEALPYLDDLFRIAMWLARDRNEAEDLVQETFTQALESFHRFEPGTNCRAWLVSIMYHMNGKRLRAGSKLRLVSDGEERLASAVASAPPTPQSITDEDILVALRALPGQFQEVVILSDVEDMTYKEISEVLGVPIGTVMSRLHRGRKLLRGELANCASAHGIGRARDEKDVRASPFSG